MSCTPDSVITAMVVVWGCIMFFAVIGAFAFGRYVSPCPRKAECGVCGQTGYHYCEPK